MTRHYRVCIVPEYPFGLMTGGVQVQAQETCRALAQLPDLDVALFNWSSEEPPADLYHFIGFPRHLTLLAELVRCAGKPYVCTLLAGSPSGPLRLGLASMKRLARELVSRGAGHAGAIRNAAAVVTITNRNRQMLSAVYGLSTDRVRVVPNGVSPRFFGASAKAWQAAHGEKSFALCVGAVQRRKNQLLLARLCNELGVPLVLLGPVPPGEEDYARCVAEEVRVNEALGGCWLRDVRGDDPLLPSAYAACRLYVLLSADETQPLSVLEAMAARKPVLLADAGYNREAPFEALPACPLGHSKSLKPSLRQAWEHGVATQLPPDFLWDGVARRLRALYLEILTPPSAPAVSPRQEPPPARP